MPTDSHGDSEDHAACNAVLDLSGSTVNTTSNCMQTGLPHYKLWTEPVFPIKIMKSFDSTLQTHNIGYVTSLAGRSLVVMVFLVFFYIYLV